MRRELDHFGVSWWPWSRSHCGPAWGSGDDGSDFPEISPSALPPLPRASFALCPAVAIVWRRFFCTENCGSGPPQFVPRSLARRSAPGRGTCGTPAGTANPAVHVAEHQVQTFAARGIELGIGSQADRRDLLPRLLIIWGASA